IKTSEVATELQDAMNHNAKCKDFMEAVEEWEEARDDSEENVKKVEAKFLQIKAKLELAHQELQDNIIGLNESIKDANKLFRVDIDPIQKKMDEIDDTNSKVRANKTRSDLQEQYEQDHDSFEELGDELDKIEAKKQDRLNNAECPVEDLEFRDDGVWYQGLPLDQDMESDQMIKCVQLASALNPELKTICIDNGERMLPAKLKELDEWAEANDYQILIFRASDSSEGCEFYLEEGKIKDE
ncbi:MAG: hypothetical protein KAS32_29170, partial [Candidatus Peribacteraceae bacterium]|nr:hypothetical protein [Candidatus Peribacteraceae bacterium]